MVQSSTAFRPVGLVGPYFDEGAGYVWMVSSSVPFYRRDNQQFDGVAFTDLKLDALAEQLADTFQDFAGEYRVIHARSGTMVDTLTSAAFMGEVDGCLRWNGYHIDVSTQKQLEKALLEAKREADDANAAKGRFLASMSHELRTPMNAVIGLADLTLNTPLNQQQHDWLKKIHRAANSQLRLINDVLDFSKFEAGKMQFETFPFVLSHVLEGACELVADQALNKGLALRVQTQPDLPEKLIGDPLRLRRSPALSSGRV